MRQTGTWQRKRSEYPSARPTKRARSEAEEAARYTREQLRTDLLRAVVTEPLLTHFKEAPEKSFDIIIALHEFLPDGIEKAFMWVEEALRTLERQPQKPCRLGKLCLRPADLRQILALAAMYRKLVKDQGDRFRSPIYRV